MSVLVNTLILLSFGIPGLVMAGLAMISIMFGLIRKEPGLLLLGAFFSIPFAYTMGTWDLPLLFVRLLPLFPALSAWALSKDEPLFAWILPAPTFFYLAYLAFSLVASDFSG